jgi:hypothetical protein
MWLLPISKTLLDCDLLGRSLIVLGSLFRVDSCSSQPIQEIGELGGGAGGKDKPPGFESARLGLLY